MNKLRLRTKGRFQPLEIQLSRQTDVIEKHERLIARHTSIQSWTNILTLIFSVITTVALIYIAYQQYTVSERQASLEYAKVAPQFMVTMETFPTQTSPAIPNKVPRSISIRVERGEAVIQNVEAYQDFSVARLYDDDGDPVHANCNVRSDNYFRVLSDFSGAEANSLIDRISDDPAFHYPDINGDFFIIRPDGTYVIISYEDIFGNTQEQVFAGKSGHLQKLPKPQLPQDSLYELVTVDFLMGKKNRYPAFFDGRHSTVKTKGCRKILHDSVISR